MTDEEYCPYCGAAMIYDVDSFGRGFMRCEIDCQAAIENDPGFGELCEWYAEDEQENPHDP